MARAEASQGSWSVGTPGLGSLGLDTAEQPGFQGCSSTEATLRPDRRLYFPQEYMSRRQVCGEEPSGGAIFKGTILRPSFSPPHPDIGYI